MWLWNAWVRFIRCSVHLFILQATLNWGKKDDPVYITEEKGVIGLNFHQSKEAQLQDHVNGYYDVSYDAFSSTFFPSNTENLCIKINEIEHLVTN